MNDYHDSLAEAGSEPETSTLGERLPSEVPPLETDGENALADAQRLATKVHQQERELTA
jgi:hypothetical protein